MKKMTIRHEWSYNAHELKTPVTALNAILDNMVMGIGKYKDYNAYLPLCKERSEQIAKMITEILDTFPPGENNGIGRGGCGAEDEIMQASIKNPEFCR